MNIRGKTWTAFLWRDRLHRVSGATVALIITGGLTRLITLLTQMVIAREFGLSLDSDAYFATENLPELFLDFIAIGFSMVFIPMFTACRLEQGEESARRFASAFFLLATVVSLICALFAAAAAPLLVTVLAPGFTGGVRETAVRLVRIMSLAIVFFGLGGGVRGLLQAHRQFVLPELARVAFNLALFLCALLLAGRFGVLVLAWGIVAGAFLQLLVQLVGAQQTGAWRWVRPARHPELRRAAGQIAPFILAIAGIKIVFVIDRVVASGLAAGDVAALNYASRLILLPVGIFALPLRTTLYPQLADLAARQQRAALAALLLRGLRILLLIVIPACVGLGVLHLPLTRLLFERGAFNSAATLATGRAVIAYAAGVPAIALIFLLNNVFLSLNTPYTLVKINLFGWVLNLGLSYGLSRRWGHLGIAAGTSVAVTVTMVLMVLVLRYGRLPTLDGRLLFRSTLRIGAVSTLMGLLLLLLMAAPAEWAGSAAGSMFQIVLLSLLGFLFYIAAGIGLKLDEWSLMSRMFREM